MSSVLSSGSSGSPMSDIRSLVSAGVSPLRPARRPQAPTRTGLRTPPGLAPPNPRCSTRLELIPLRTGELAR
eukprot:14949036-Alexandrium_andersonii.AAC.1